MWVYFSKQFFKAVFLGSRPAVSVAKTAVLFLSALFGILGQDRINFVFREEITMPDHYRFVQIGWVVLALVLLPWAASAITLAWKTLSRIRFLDERIDSGSWDGHYAIPIYNSSWSTLKNVAVVWESSVPSVPHQSVSLHCKGENPSTDHLLTLTPGTERIFDVFQISQDNKWRVMGAGNLFEILPQKYEVTLSIHADDTLPRKDRFGIEPTPDGRARFYPLRRNNKWDLGCWLRMAQYQRLVDQVLAVYVRQSIRCDEIRKELLSKRQKRNA